MSRLVIPTDFPGQQTLLSAILAQNTKLGTKSPLLQFLKKQNFNAAKLQSSISAAADQNTASSSLKRNSENDTQQRNIALELPWEHFTGEVQFLKHYYAGTERELGEWGVTVDAQNRIVYPTGTAAEVALIQTFLTHHKSFPPGESPLQWYIDEHEIDVEADLLSAANALAVETDRNITTGDGELATQQRNKIWDPSVKAIHLIGAYLMNLYHEDSRKMAAWGFTVVEDAGGEKEQITTIEPTLSKNIQSIKIPSILKNIGTVAVDVTKGKGDKAITANVLPGKELGMTKGYSRITVTNSSTLVTARIQVTVSK